ncbi:serine/threonine-protein kinase [Actinomycetospora sp. C-140]
MSVDAGETVGPYRLEGLIGRGGMGEVYRAFDTRRQRTVALKLLPTWLSNDSNYRERFRRESLTAAGLSSPHVIPIHDFGEVAGRLFIDMRLINGSDLASRLAQGPFEPDRAVNVLRQVGDALTDAHQHGIAHRDIKPSNILLTDTDFAYLVDFGIARAGGDTPLTETGTTVGTFGYMAPERLADSASDHRADIYSLTCVLYELLTGQRPFGNLASAPRLIQAHLRETPYSPTRLNPGVPSGFDEIIAKGMAKNPGNRYHTVEQLIAACLQVGRDHRAPAPASGDGFVSFTQPQPQQKTRPSAPGAMEFSIAPEPMPAGSPRHRPLRLVLTAAAAVLLIAVGASAALLLRAPQDIATTPNAAAPPNGVPTTTQTTAAPAGSSSPAAGASAPVRYIFRLSGTARAATINWGADGSMGSATEAPLPWSRDLDTNQGASYHFATLAAFTPGGDPGDLTCTILDQTGRVISTQTAASQGGPYGSATVNCSGT